MKFNVCSTLSYDVYSPTTFFFNIKAIKSATQIVESESLVITPPIAFEEFQVSNSDSRFIKLEVEKGCSFTITYRAEVTTSYIKIDEQELLKPMPFIKMDHEALAYISPSRHCESDKLMEFAKKNFGSLPNAYVKALAIEDWIFTHISYVQGSTNSSASATDTLLRTTGVCKDFAHLGIAMCRALDIPARYFAGYASHLNPPDFHACFEAYINGHWIVFDPTKLAGLNGLVRVSRAKDASEAPIAIYFGDIACTFMDVQCHPVSTEFVPFNWEHRRSEALSY
ncbi:MAG: transglutaminase family protein [Bacteroidetes bacterium]|nr:transglutaminase family protein [Bacteroidota bacterium]